MPALAGDNSRMRKAESATIKSDALTVSRTTTALRLARTPQSARLPSSGTLHASFPRAGDHQQASQQLRQPEPPVLAGPVAPRTALLVLNIHITKQVSTETTHTTRRCPYSYLSSSLIRRPACRSSPLVHTKGRMD